MCPSDGTLLDFSRGSIALWEAFGCCHLGLAAEEFASGRDGVGNWALTLLARAFGGARRLFGLASAPLRGKREAKSHLSDPQ